MTGRKSYAIAALILLAIEMMIALFVTETFVRGYMGDVLAVMLVYAVLRAVTPLGAIAAASISLVIALAIEIAQALNLLGALGLSDNTFARVVLGGSFDWLDIAAYMAGALIVLAVELLRGKRL
ncbi:MAG: hypothetical protein B7Y90_08125 [Alphaproteobacteria bacterium 32-64-14]|nr:MAG: hypothetical protein B7Y90_08125 [Alphaproteobacteria bacterium 32-64-14]